MSAIGNVRETERTLRRCAKRATAKGVALISENFDGHDAGGHAGVCILGAYNRCCGEERLALPDDADAMAEAWDSIEMGWDGVPHRKAKTQTNRRVVKRWWTLGYRLRRSLRPTRAAS